ncbi:MAG: YgaP-like transmembrane domain [Methanocella sp.]
MIWELERWLATPAGRVVRVAVGAVLVLLGVSTRGTWRSSIPFVVIGLIPLIAGAFDLCFLSAVAGGPLRGDEFREWVRERV